MPSTVHVNRRLTDASLMYPPDFEPIGSKFFLDKPTDFLSDQFASMSKANMLGLRDAAPIGDAGHPSLVDVVFDADTSFSIPIYGLRNPERYFTQRNADPSLSYEQMRTVTLTSAMRVRMEYLRVNQRLRSTAYMTTNKTLIAAERFDNKNSNASTPVTLLQRYADRIANAANGRRPNVAACAIETVRAIASSEEFKDYVKFNVIQDAESIVKQPNGQVRLIEQLIGLAPGTLNVHDAVYNAGSLASPAYRKFIGSDFVMAYVEPLGVTSYTACVGWRWKELGTESAIVEVPDFTTPLPTTALHIINATEPQVVKPELAVLIKGCVDTTDTTYGSILD